jgi:hypothetical protein
MGECIEAAQARLVGNFYGPIDEWEYLTALPCSESERIKLLKWVFSEAPAYWGTRVRAGRILLEVNEEETWQAIEKLVDSSDPDDNGTALTLFEELDDPRCFELARRWLRDEAYPATQLDAIEFLWEIYPEQVHQHLKILVNHENIYSRQRAQKLLAQYNSQ